MPTILNKLKKNIGRHKKSYLAYIGYVVLTGLAIFYAPYTKLLASWVLWTDLQVEQMMNNILIGGSLCFELNFIIALMITPLLIVAIPAGIYGLIKRSLPPYLIHTIWMLWMMATVSRLLSQ